MKRFFVFLFFVLIPTSFSYATFVDQDLVTQINGSMVSVGGKINTAVNPLFKTFSIKGYLSTSSTFATTVKTDVPPTKAIANDGTYGWTFPDLPPSTTYYFKQKVSDGKTTEESKAYTITTTAATASGSASSSGSQSDFDKRSYRLLAPFPGLSVLLDPDLCQEQKLSGKSGQICDINDFLNYMFKLLVSLAAVMLVLRLVYEGYQYIVTDIPFLKASAKSGFMEALGGLVLALSAYLILNTINPKLVENSISISKVAVGIDEYGESDKAFVRNIPGANFTKANFPAGVLCPGTGGKTSISSIAASWQGKATYSQALRGTKAPENTFYLDCSSYVATVLSCAGITPPITAPGINTQQLFEQNMGAEKVTDTDFSQTGDKISVKGKELQPGDLVGWRWLKPQTDKGHILIYVGGGKFRESQVAKGATGKSVQGEKDLSRVLSDIRKTGYVGYLKRM